MYDINSIKKFAESTITNQARPDYSFRSRYTHSLRVRRWALQLQKIIGGDEEVLSIAALLHDVGWKEGINHAIVSHEIALEFLKDYKNPNKEKILEAILYHNRRDTKNLNLESYIIMDADLLDEVGATTIIWDVLSSAKEEKVSYYTALERIKKYSGNLHKQETRFHFQESKDIFNERVNVIKEFIKELSYELEEVL